MSHKLFMLLLAQCFAINQILEKIWQILLFPANFSSERYKLWLFSNNLSFAQMFCIVYLTYSWKKNPISHIRYFKWQDYYTPQWYTNENWSVKWLSFQFLQPFCFFCHIIPNWLGNTKLGLQLFFCLSIIDRPCNLLNNNVITHSLFLSIIELKDKVMAPICITQSYLPLNSKLWLFEGKKWKCCVNGGSNQSSN